MHMQPFSIHGLCRSCSSGHMGHTAHKPCFERCECTSCPTSSQQCVNPRLQVDLWMPLWWLWVSWRQWLGAESVVHGGDVLPGSSRAPGAMGPHLAGWYQRHCCPAPLFSCPLPIFVFHWCICLDDSRPTPPPRPRDLLIPQLQFN